jgi:hypothetical protein
MRIRNAALPRGKVCLGVLAVNSVELHIVPERRMSARVPLPSSDLLDTATESHAKAQRRRALGSHTSCLAPWRLCVSFPP